MISNNLISEVLGFKCSSYQELGDDNIIYPLVHYGWNKGIEQIGNAKQYPKGINIYELAHKCKEWVNSFPTWEDDYAGRQKGIFMQVMPIQRDNKTIYYSRIVYKDYCVIMPNSEFTADTEQEAIFKACEWILIQLKQSKDIKCGS